MKLLKYIVFGLLGLAVIAGILIAGVAYYLHTPIDGERLARMQKSPYFSDGAFKNAEPQAATEITWDFLKQQFFGEQVREPTGEVPVVNVSADSLKAPASQALKVTWLGHASVLVEIDGMRILADPVLSERVSPFTFAGPKRLHPSPIALSELQSIDAVVISHNHYDHLDEATTRHLAAQGTKFYLPLGVGAYLEEWGVPANQMFEMQWWQSATVGPVKITATPSRHYSGRGMLDYKKTQWASWVIEGANENVFFSGDTGNSKFFAQIGERKGPFDLTIMKIGAYGPSQAWIDIHMPAEDAVSVHKVLGGKRMLPVHWATFNLAIHEWQEPIVRTIKAAQETGVELMTPRPGEPFSSDRPFTNKPWWEGVQ